MTIATCSSCGERVFTIKSWSDVDHCPACGRSLAQPDAVGPRVQDQIRREAARFRRTRDPRASSGRKTA
ncbi:MAG: hypothetical protein M3Y34_02115 [Actinomycetota bacterium]|nr:hypothetical protein [Actinomycetota bacterium]